MSHKLINFNSLHFLFIVPFTFSFFSCGNTSKFDKKYNFNSEQLENIFYDTHYHPKIYKDSFYGVVHIDSILNIYPKSEALQSLKLFFKAYGFHYNNQLDSALVYNTKAEEFLDKKWQTHGFLYLRVLKQRAEINVQKKNTKEAVRIYFEGTQYIENNFNKNLCLSSLFTGEIAMIYYKQNDLTTAISYFEKAFGESNFCSEQDFELSFYKKYNYLNAIGLSYLKMKDYEKAKIYFDSTIAFLDYIILKQPDQTKFYNSARNLVLGNLGGMYSQIGNYKLSDSLLLLDIKANLNDEIFNPAGINAFFVYAQNQIKQGNIKAANRIVDSIGIYILPRFENDVNVRIKHFEVLADIQEANGNYKAALENKKKFISLRDSLTSEIKETFDLNLNSEFLKLNNEYSLAKVENRLRIRNIIISSTLALITFFLYIFYITIKSSKKKNELIKKLKDLYKELNSQNIKLNSTIDALELSQIKNKELMNVIAHDMRNPIASIVSISDFLLNDDTMLENEKRKFLEMQLKAGNDALRYMSDILNERNNVFFDSKKLTEIQKVLHNCADMCSVLALEKNIKIIIDAEEQILKLDEDKIWSVINNLISNAIKFSNANTNIEITGKVVNESYRIRVKDSGIGIPNELKDKIFLQDERVKREGTNGEVSYGLGLSIAKHIIQSHNGKIWFESEEGKGTTFFIELPI